LFNGLAQVIVQSDRHAGRIVVEAVPEGALITPLLPATITIETRAPAMVRLTA